MTTRLIAVLDDPAPGPLDVAFAVLAGWEHYEHRARPSELGRHTVAGEAASVLDSRTKAIAQLSRLAETDQRMIDQRIGLTPAGRTAAVWFGCGAP